MSKNHWEVKTLSMTNKTIFLLCHTHTDTKEEFPYYIILKSIVPENPSDICRKCNKKAPKTMLNNVIFLNKLENTFNA